MANTRKDIDWDLAAKFAQAGSDGKEIADYFGIHADTFYRRCETDQNAAFAAWIQQNRSKGDAVLRLKQYEAATEDKNTGMQIWLGKQRLGQKDKSEIDQTINLPNINLIMPEGEWCKFTINNNGQKNMAGNTGRLPGYCQHRRGKVGQDVWNNAATFAHSLQKTIYQN